MLRIRRQTGAILFLTLLAGLTWWLAQTQDEVVPTLSGDASDVDYYLHDAQTVVMRSDGQVARIVQAQKVRHLSQSGAILFNQPVLIIHRYQEPPWQIQSDQGEMTAEGDWVYLQGDVKINRDAMPPDIRPVQLHTQYVRIRPEQGYVETDEPVEIYSGQDWLKAVGMRAWLHKPVNIQLLEKVQGFYAAPT